MRFKKRAIFSLLLTLLVVGTAVMPLQTAPAPQQLPVDYDIVYVRQPRRGDNEHIRWPEVFYPHRVEAGSDLMLLHADGTEELLVAGGDGGVTDPFVSFDGEWVYYSYFYNVRPEFLNPQRDQMPYQGSDIFRIHLPTRQTEQLTFGEFTPNLGAGNWDPSNPLDPPGEYNRLGYGILNLGAAPLAGGKVIFTSNRNGFTPTKNFTSPTLQLFVMDEDGRNVTPIAPMTLGSALHPTPLRDGRVMFSSYESEGLRDQRLWGIWTIWPDGRQWEPMVSAFKPENALHFMTQLSNGDVVVEDYYNLNNWGFGALYRLPVNSTVEKPWFHSAIVSENPPIPQTIGTGDNTAGFAAPFQISFTPKGMQSLTPFTHAADSAAPVPPGGGTRVGKFTHPSAAPANDLLVVWSPGPANVLERPVNLPAVDAGLYLIPNGNVVNSPADLVLLKNEPNYNEVWPRAVVPYATVHGISEPVELPWLPNDGSEHNALPAGTPYGLVGTSSFYKRSSFPGRVTAWADDFDGLDAFNTSENEQSPNWFTQGADAGKYDNSDIWAVRILAMEPNTHRSYGPNSGQHFFNHINEKLRILGEIPLRKVDSAGNPILDREGNPDTSFLAKIPADTPFSFQMLDRNGMVLTMAQTWHQVRPGEVRTDCGGCHAHDQAPLDFAETAAAQPDYQLWDLTATTPLLSQDNAGEPTLKTAATGVVNIEFYQDIRPLLQANCVQCHTANDPTPPGNLVLDDLTIAATIPNTGIELPGDYARLCYDSDAHWGYPPLVTVGDQPVWRQTNASRYIRKLQSRRSLLLWKLFGERLDGWSNADHPTESTPGDPATLPTGATINAADLDFTGEQMPPPGSGTLLTIDQKMTFARWVDLGCPINTGSGSAANYGWFLDDLRPTVALSTPRAGHNQQPLTAIQFGLADAYTGVDFDSLSVTADIGINHRAPGEELADLALTTGVGIYTIVLDPPLTDVTAATLNVAVADGQGNVTAVNRSFSVGTSAPTPTPTPTPPPNPNGPQIRLGHVGTIPGGTVTVPVFYTKNSNNVTSVIFAVALGHTCLQFDPADSDANGQLDAVTFDLPVGYNGSATLKSGSRDQLNFVIIDPAPPLVPLPDIILANITFNVRDTLACRPLLDTPIDIAVNFAEMPPASFGNTAGASVAGSSENGVVTIHQLQSGDGNGDGAVDAGDLAACVLEIFDGDGSDPVDVESGSFRGTTGCDANGDTTIDAGDLSCVVLLIFAGPDSCGTTRIAGTASAQLIIGRAGVVADGSHTIPIKLAGQGHAIAAAAFALGFDTPIDPTDEDSNGLPDAIAVTGMAEEQVVTATWQNDQLHIAITEETTPFAAFADGPLVLVTLTAGAFNTEVRFATDVPPSLGSTDGRSVPVESQLEPLRILLPMVMR